MRDAGGFVVPADHPSLPGHFPGRPVVPGVVLLDAVAACLRPHLPGRLDLAAAKFTAPVLPGQPVAVAWDEAGSQAQFICSVGGRPVLRGAFRVAS